MQNVKWLDHSQVASTQQLQTQIIEHYQPQVLRRYYAQWPVVAHQQDSPAGLVEYLKLFDCSYKVTTYCAPPAVKGRFFYGDDLRRFNFERTEETLVQALERIVALQETENPPAVYAGAVDVASALPGFERDHRCELAGHTARARLWLGNATTVSTHYDLADNLMCAVAGRRRVTLFPPEQLKNLYVGPIDFTLSGQPVSMVNLEQPDLERFPRFAEALQHAQAVELEPGDVLYIPKLWWHHVQSLAPVNAMVNYWWDHSALGKDNGFTTMMHALTTIAHLPEAERRAWRAFFDHYVFKIDGDPAAHLDEKHRGILGKMTPALYHKISAYVRAMLSK